MSLLCNTGQQEEKIVWIRHQHVQICFFQSRNGVHAERPEGLSPVDRHRHRHQPPPARHQLGHQHPRLLRTLLTVQAGVQKGLQETLKKKQEKIAKTAIVMVIMDHWTTVLTSLYFRTYARSGKCCVSVALGLGYSEDKIARRHWQSPN